MDFHSLARRELQALCKKNKIPANITNVAMADALKALDTVEGLEDVLMTVKTSTDLLTKTEIKQSLSRTTCRTSTRRKPVLEEPHTTQILTRTCGGARRAPAAAPVDMVCQKMESQLKEAADDEKKAVETPAVMTAVSRRKTGMTSVKEGYSTRRNTRLLEKKLMGLNLDDVSDDNQIVDGDAQVVEEMKVNEESVVDKEMEFEGISKQNKPNDIEEKNGESDEKKADLLEDSLMVDNNEPSLKVELNEKTEVLDEPVPDKNAEVFVENNGYLESVLGKMECTINGSTDGFVLENEVQGFTAVKEPFQADSLDQMKMNQEKFEDNEENNKRLALNEISTDFINKDEFEPEKSMTMVVTQINEETSKDEVSDDDHDHLMENEESLALDEISKDESEIVDHFDAEVGMSKENAETKSPKTTEKLNEIPDIIIINKENFVKEKIEKVKLATEDMSMRQLRTMLKQLQIKNNNAHIKEDEDIAKQTGKARLALQPNCHKHANGN